MPGPWEQDILQRLERLERKYRCVACCDDEFGLTALAPPVDAPGAKDPDVLFNRETNQMWSWNGSAWVEFSLENTLLYSAYVTQSGTSDPAATEQANTLGEVPTWSRLDIGHYEILVTGEQFTIGTNVQITVDAESATFVVKASVSSTNTIEVRTYDDAGAIVDLDGGFFIQVNIYF